MKYDGNLKYNRNQEFFNNPNADFLYKVKTSTGFNSMMDTLVDLNKEPAYTGNSNDPREKWFQYNGLYVKNNNTLNICSQLE